MQDLKFKQKLEKLQNRLNTCNCVIGIGMVPDVNGRIAQADEEWAVACAVQNMHLMYTAYGLGAKWTTPSSWCCLRSRKPSDCQRQGRRADVRWISQPESSSQSRIGGR